MGRDGTTRRRALTGAGATAAAALLAGCTSSGGGEPSADARRERVSAAALRALRTRTAATSTTLLGRYDAVIARHPEQRARLAPLRSAVAEHVKALAPAGAAPSASASVPASASSSASAPASASSGPAAEAGSRGGAVPADAAEAVRSLVSAERNSGKAQTAALMDAPPELARLLASVAAANAVHAYLLSRGASS
ncbi:hypothetical protein [Streptomyces montanisoli]|uniref:Lipoprotein n=1 Tax=Streptomyces montanisoli TaxID=2798581 RepID=A0A940M8C7_9ACTN|nr:hypothetical protein [Streptomyces montanisoli]MBP0456167.1 hypothetical protein [Streptomyces montanisoli]